MHLDEMINRLADLRLERQTLAAADKTLSQEQAKLEGDLMQQMLEVGTLRAASARGNSVSIKKTLTPAVTNWDQFYDFVATSRRFDMLQRRLSATAIRDTWDAGEAVPGLSSTEVWSVSLHTSRS